MVFNVIVLTGKYGGKRLLTRTGKMNSKIWESII